MVGYTHDDSAGAGATRARLGGVFTAHNAAVQAHVHTRCGGGTPAQPWERPCAALQVTPTAAEGRLLDSTCQAALDAMRAHATSIARAVDGFGDGVGDDRCATNPAARAAAAAAAAAVPAAAVSVQGGVKEADGAEARKPPTWAELPPRCPECAAPLRPSVLMFGDDDPALLRRLTASADAYQAWEEGMEVALASDSRARLVILELGCGTRVPSVREEAQCVLRDAVARGGRATLIRINPDEPAGDESAGGIPTDIPTASGDHDGVLFESPSTGSGGTVDDPVSPHVLVLRRPAASAMVRLDALMKQMDACGSCSEPEAVRSASGTLARHSGPAACAAERRNSCATLDG